MENGKSSEYEFMQEQLWNLLQLYPGEKDKNFQLSKIARKDCNFYVIFAQIREAFHTQVTAQNVKLTLWEGG